MASASAKVPSHLTIKVLYSDDDIIVIDKPCNLRSVPGHAADQDESDVNNNAHDDVEAAREKPQRLTAQEAWVNAIRSFALEHQNVSSTQTDQDGDNQSQAVDELIKNLSATPDANSIPRKCPTFERYCQRNRRRLLPSYPELDRFTTEEKVATQEPPTKRQKKSNNIPTQLRNIAQITFSLIQQRQRPLMNLPTPTDDEDSAIGQLRLLGFGDYAHNNHGPPESMDDVKRRISNESREDEKKKFKLYVVHRLDCQVCFVICNYRLVDWFLHLIPNPIRCFLSPNGDAIRLQESW
jgi:hypothetical protein